MKPVALIASVAVAVAIAIPAGLFATEYLRSRISQHREANRLDQYKHTLESMKKAGAISAAYCGSTTWVELPSGVQGITAASLDVIRTVCSEHNEGVTEIRVHDGKGNFFYIGP